MKLDRQQFETMILGELDSLYRYARQLSRDTSQTEDLVQETCLKALKNWQQFDLQTYGIKPWLLKICHNICVSSGLRENKQPASTPETQLDQHQQVPSATEISSRMELWDSMDEYLVSALQSLPEDYRTVLVLWAIEELPYREIADIVQVPLGTVMSRLHRAREKLVELLEPYAKKERIIRE